MAYRTEIPIVVLSPVSPYGPVSGASVYVTNRISGTPAIVYQADSPDNTQITATGNLTTDSSGRVTGWVDRGSWQAVITIPGRAPYTEYFESDPSRDGGIDTAWIADAAITTVKLNDSSVTSAKIVDATIATGDIANNAVDNTKLKSDAVTDANRAVTTDHIRNSAITSAKLATGAVTAPALAANVVPIGAVIDWWRPPALTSVSSSGSTFTKTNHGLQTGQTVIFSSVTGGGGLIVVGTIYFVTVLTTNTFSLSATLGGGAITPSPVITTSTLLWAVPNGWALCDGTSWASITNDMNLSTGTIPNLINAVTMGARAYTANGTDYANPADGLASSNGTGFTNAPGVGGIGGSNASINFQHSHTVTIPGHYHSLGTTSANTNLGNAGNHAHVTDDGTQSLVKMTSNSGAAGQFSLYVNGSGTGNLWKGWLIASTNTTGDHGHSVSTSLSGNPGNTGGSYGDNAFNASSVSNQLNAAQDVRPAHVGMLKIMKVRNV